MSDPLDLPHLVRVCEAASASPWHQGKDRQDCVYDKHCKGVCVGTRDSGGQVDKLNMNFIATFNPSTVLALLRRLGEAEELFMKVSQLLDGWHSDQAWTADDESLRRAITAWRQNKAKGRPHDAE